VDPLRGSEEGLRVSRAYAHPHGDHHPDWPDTHADADFALHGHAHGDAGHTYGHVDSDSDGDLIAHAYSHCQPDVVSHPHLHAHAYGNALAVRTGAGYRVRRCEQQWHV
jgi:hypothetical protein